MLQITIDGQELKVKFKHINIGNIRTFYDKRDFNHFEYNKILSFANEIICKALKLKQINNYRINGGSYFRKSPGLLNGITICELSQDKVAKGIGFSFCGKEDQFNKKVGRKISLDRAIYDYTVRRDENRELPESFIYNS